MQTIDPVNNKKQIKASITNAIAKLVTGSNRDEIALRVEETYERLLVGATVFTHPIAYRGLCKARSDREFASSIADRALMLFYFSWIVG